ncbi:MAG TPA: polysaccharide deacetylase family protein [Thermoanaerobaculia bacterium]|nr:polysaccharide deacetylase family protein [Thermoanaerobaculia bacterium]
MRQIILTGLVVAPFAAIIVWHWSILGAFGIIALSHGLVLYPTLRPNVQWLGPVMTRFETTEREVWLTVDDGPTDDTAALLDLFDARGVKATFFVKGVLAEKHPESIREIVRRGHTIGNHSYSHPSATFWCLPAWNIAAQIERCNLVLANILGAPPKLFRAPVGTKNPSVHPVLKRNGLTLVGWSARAFDTKTSDPDRVVGRIMPDIAPGTIILLHQGRRESVAMLARVIDEVQARGYRFVIPPTDRLRTNK